MVVARAQQSSNIPLTSNFAPPRRRRSLPGLLFSHGQCAHRDRACLLSNFDYISCGATSAPPPSHLLGIWGSCRALHYHMHVEPEVWRSGLCRCWAGPVAVAGNHLGRSCGNGALSAAGGTGRCSKHRSLRERRILFVTVWFIGCTVHYIAQYIIAQYIKFLAHI